MSSHGLSSVHSYPASFTTTNVPAPPMPIPFGALPSLDGQPRRMSVTGHTADPGHAPPPAQLTLVRLRPTRLLDLPRRLMHPPELPEFMQSESAALEVGVREKSSEASGSRGNSGGHTGGIRGDGGQGPSKKGKGKQTEPDVQDAGLSVYGVEEDRASGAAGRTPSPPRPPPSPPTPKFPSSIVEKPPAKKRRAWHRQWNWGITPSFDVKLEDVIERKHLPPLGLKDFEEWLLFVEGCAENLYFILWLREYTTRYEAWTSSHKQQARRTHASEVSSTPFAVTNPQSRQRGPYSSSQPQVHAERTVRPSERPFASLHLAMSRVGLGSSAQGQAATPSSPAPSHIHDDAASGTGSSASMPRVGDTHPYRHDPSFPHSVQRSAPSSSSLSRAGDEPDDGDDDAYSGYGVNVVQRGYRTPAPTRQPNPMLSLFYLRAKETFLSPNAPYELCVGSDILAVFHTVSGGAHEYMHPWTTALGAGKLPPPPDPYVFRELKELVEGRLKASLDRLVVATYNNVGMPRAYCGCGGGFVIGLIGSAPPLAASFALGGPRWYRLLALPGMWLGMTIFISAWYGVCMMIYIFGDLRQLRSFELARPAFPNSKEKGKEPSSVSTPMPLTRPPRPLLSIIPPGIQSRRGSVQSEDIPLDVMRTPTAAAPREADVTEEDETGDIADGGEYGEEEEDDDEENEDDDDDDDDDEDGDDEDEDEDEEPHIEISDAFYDEHPSPEGPATAPWFQRHSQPQVHEGGGNPLWPDYEGDSTEHATAAFIGSYVYDGSECAAGGAPRAGAAAGARAADVEQMKRDAAACQPLAEFDFDGLPPRKTSRPAAGAAAPAAAASTAARTPLTPRRSSFATTRPEDPSPGPRVGRPAKTKADARACAKEEKAKSKSRSPSPSGSSMNGSLKARKWWSWWWWQFVEWVQTMCSPENAVDVYEKESRLIGGYPFGGTAAGPYDAPRAGECAKGKGGEAGVAALTAHVAGQPPANAPQPLNTRRRSRWREGLKKAYLAVPAFASPLTPVLNPLVGRAQWEIVVRSAAMALILSCVVVGSLLAVPE